MPTALEVTRQITQAFFGNLTNRDASVGRKLYLLGAFTASGLRFASGMMVGRLGPRPAQPLVLWDFEACPHCRIVREALCTLDIDVEVRPCPRGGTRFRPELAGNTVPRLHDPNAGVTLSESVDIVSHLYTRYGAGRPPRLLNLAPVRVGTGLAGTALTIGRGRVARPSRAPAQPLRLWSFEASPYCHAVRARLCELELPYILHNLAKGSPRRAAFVERTGKMQVPYLHDPNTDTAMFESLAIERYLEERYAG